VPGGALAYSDAKQRNIEGYNTGSEGERPE
jgi:hypothetical protein